MADETGPSQPASLAGDARTGASAPESAPEASGSSPAKPAKPAKRKPRGVADKARAANPRKVVCAPGKRNGRPPKWTDERKAIAQEIILEMIADGVPLADICRPSKRKREERAAQAKILAAMTSHANERDAPELAQIMARQNKAANRGKKKDPNTSEAELPAGTGTGTAQATTTDPVLAMQERYTDRPEVLEVLGDMPEIRTVYDWLETSLRFDQRYRRARQDQADKLADEIISIADDQSLDPNSRRVMVEARKWVASKLKPSTYGDKIEVTGTVTVTAEEARGGLSMLLGVSLPPLPGDDQVSRLPIMRDVTPSGAD